MKLKTGLLALAAMLAVTGCNRNSESDVNGDGKVSADERVKELAQDGYMPVKPGRWKTEFKFTDIDVPRLGKKEKADLLREAESGASGVSCLSAAEAAKPGADFFGGEGAEECTYKKFDLAGSRASMQVVCGMGTLGKADMELDGTVGDTQFDFDTKLTVSVPLAGKIKLAGTLTGKHDGACQGNE
jgi:Protein of unknown function (DUF3617)